MYVYINIYIYIFPPPPDPMRPPPGPRRRPLLPRPSAGGSKSFARSGNVSNNLGKLCEYFTALPLPTCL